LFKGFVKPTEHLYCAFVS